MPPDAVTLKMPNMKYKKDNPTANTELMSYNERKNMKAASRVPIPATDIGNKLTITTMEPLHKANQKGISIPNAFERTNIADNFNNHIAIDKARHLTWVPSFIDFNPL